MSINVDDLVDLAKAVGEGDPIDWSDLNMSEDQTYSLIASSVIEQFSQWKQSGDTELVMLATITKLVVENFVLNLKLHTKEI